MSSSTLDPDNMPEPDRQLGKGHSNKELGPSDLSDTGSDVQPGIRAIDEPGFGLDLDRGTTEDPDIRNIEASDDNEDSTATGEDVTAGREGDVELNADIETDRIDYLSPDLDLDAGTETAPEDLPPPRRQNIERPTSR
ncbi:hypothetical protein EDC30_10214 [Paucimonas lemoignei]|uniref:Uncharacterized protein n=1 Tax=Paucimonas lemoignei TaxID=29443 RepID=A0A4R3I2Z5_PAULE|nr:hypothetical protein [Paucimonas lemoignei]TCS38279.1 hypothetical protein EDC30_10214 [Paucimonas lemoignei]